MRGCGPAPATDPVWWRRSSAGPLAQAAAAPWGSWTVCTGCLVTIGGADAAGAWAIGVPQEPQERLPGEIAKPQVPQEPATLTGDPPVPTWTEAFGAPHEPQKCSAARTAAPQ